MDKSEAYETICLKYANVILIDTRVVYLQLIPFRPLSILENTTTFSWRLVHAKLLC
jgi:hypothetical protein